MRHSTQKRIKIAHKHRHTTKDKTPARKQKNYTQPSHQHKSKPFPATNTTKIRTNLIHFVYIKHPNKKPTQQAQHFTRRATIPHTPAPQRTKLYIIYIMRLL